MMTGRLPGVAWTRSCPRPVQGGAGVGRKASDCSPGGVRYTAGMSPDKLEASSEVQRVQVTIDWKRGKWASTPRQYSREHQWHCSGLVLTVTDALPPEGYRDSARLDPLQAYVATISSAHMLAWLHTAFGLGADVASYRDVAEGVLSELPNGRNWVNEVILRPQVSFNAKMGMTAAAIAHVHEVAIEDCFIANSIRTKITIANA